MKGKEMKERRGKKRQREEKRRKEENRVKEKGKRKREIGRECIRQVKGEKRMLFYLPFFPLSFPDIMKGTG